MPPSTVSDITHADAVRQRILEGAARAFARSGLQGTSVPDIAAECGISVGLLYRYFSGKGELYTAICTARTTTEAAALRLEMDAISDPGRRLERAVDFYLDRLSDEGGAGLLVGALAEASTNEVVRTALRARRETIGLFIKAFLDDQVAAGALPADLDRRDYSRAITMMLDGAVAEWAVAGPEIDWSGVRRAILAALAGLLGPTVITRPKPPAPA